MFSGPHFSTTFDQELAQRKISDEDGSGERVDSISNLIQERPTQLAILFQQKCNEMKICHKYKFDQTRTCREVTKFAYMALQ